MIILSHPTGNQNVRNATLALAEAGLLEEFWTCLAPNASSIGRLLQGWAGASPLARRNVAERVVPFTHQHPVIEILRLAAIGLGWGSLVQHEIGRASIDAVFRSLDAHVARRLNSAGITAKGIYAYEDGAVESFRSARARGVHTIYDLPIGYWRTSRRIAQEEAERLPEWSGTLPGLRDSEAKLQRKDEELQLAGTIIVASQFTACTLQDAPFPLPTPVIIPYGCDVVALGIDRLQGRGRDGAVSTPQVASKGKQLRVLFVGSLSQRKGIYELFKAVGACAPGIALTLVGSRVGESAARDRQLARHRWIPTLAHDAILRLMREHDVLVFPSLFEGFGLVITEALSQGVPVITTAHTGGPDILTNGADGFLVPIRDWEAIACRLEQLLRDRDCLDAMKEAARATAVQCTWESYRTRLVKAVRGALAEQGNVLS